MAPYYPPCGFQQQLLLQILLLYSFQLYKKTPFQSMSDSLVCPKNVQASWNSAGALNILLQFLLKAYTWFTLNLWMLLMSLSNPTPDPAQGRVIAGSIICM